MCILLSELYKDLIFKAALYMRRNHIELLKGQGTSSFKKNMKSSGSVNVVYIQNDESY